MNSLVRKTVLSVVAVLFLGCFLCSYAQSAASPIGYWRQWDDVTGRPHSVIQIWEKDSVLYGKILKGYPDENGVLPPKNCLKCKGDFYNKPMIGMTILTGFTQSSDNQWSGGQIMDPDSGKTYSCQLTLIEDGKKLKVRGYVGVTLLGRTQVWERINRHDI